MGIILRSIRNLRRKKFRTFLVVVFLSLIIGIFVTMFQISRASSQKYAEFESRIQNTIEVRPLGSLGIGGKRLTPFPFGKTVEKIRAIPNIVKVERYLIKRTFFEDESFEIIMGLDPESSLRVVGEPEPIDDTLIAGRGIKDTDADKTVAIIGKAIAKREGITPQTLSSSTITLNGKVFTVIGIFDSGNEFTDSQIFIPFRVMKEVFNPKGISKFFVTVDNILNTARVVQKLKALLKGADIVANEASIDLAKSSLQVIGSTSLYASIFFFLIGAILIVFVMMLVFRERLKEVGILKALGASNSEIAKQFVAESVALTLIGGVGGLLISSLALYFFSLTWTNIQFNLVQSAISLPLIFKTIIASVILGAVGSAYPIIRSIRLSPVETLRME